jgi:TolB-like protein/Flp pilus assembly protein TadD
MADPSPFAVRDGPGESPSGGSKVAPQPALAELERIAAGEVFRQADRLNRFLKYVVEETLAGRGSELKEYRLGVDVFDRPPAFDPRLDPIVRISASRLRSKLEQYYSTEGKADPVQIEIPKGGYAAVISFRHDGGLEPAGGRHRPGASAASRRWWLVGAAALAVLAGIAGFALYGKHAAVAPSKPGRIMLAVLPFSNLSGDPQEEYLSDGLTEEVIARLGNLNPQQLGVIARTSVMGYKNSNKRIDQIAGELGVDYVLEGSVRRAGKVARITAQLIQARDQTHLWAQNYDGDLGDLLTFESGIAEATAREISIQLQPAEKSGHTGAPVSAAAREAYLKGRYLWNQRTDEAIRKSIGYFEQATTLEPGYAQAYSGLAEGYVVLVSDDTSQHNQENVAKARAAAQKAIELDDSLAEPYAALAHLKFLYDWDYDGADAEYRHALERGPNSATAHHWYGVLLLYEGRYQPAVVQLKQAQALDPLSMVIGSAIALNHLFASRYDDALAQAKAVVAMNPGFAIGHNILGGVYEFQRDYPQAVAEYQKYVELSARDPDAVSHLARCYAVMGKTDESRRLLRELEDRGSTEFMSPSNPAAVYAALGEKDKALELLQQAVEERSSAMLALSRDPAYKALHGNPRFDELTRRVGLPR